MLRKYGREGPNEVARRMRKAQKAGDPEGRAAWRAVGEALMELARKPTKDDKVN